MYCLPKKCIVIFVNLKFVTAASRLHSTKILIYFHQCFNIVIVYKAFFIVIDTIHGKLDQKNSQLEVDYAIGRDTQSNELGSIVDTLQEWCDSCEAVLRCVETQIHRANAEKNRALKHKETIENEVHHVLLLVGLMK